METDHARESTTRRDAATTILGDIHKLRNRASVRVHVKRGVTIELYNDFGSNLYQGKCWTSIMADP